MEYAKPKKNRKGEFICAICKNAYNNLSYHIRSHDMTVKDYRYKFGLKQSESLLNKETREFFVKANKKNAKHLASVAYAGKKAGHKSSPKHPEHNRRSGAALKKANEKANEKEKVEKMGKAERYIYENILKKKKDN